MLDGLGWIKGRVFHFHNRIDESLRVPHMGWNTATIQNESELTKNFEGELRFYFVHSYFVLADNPNHSMMKTNYGTSFDSALCQDNIFGAQFHPEKSHKFGMNLFRNFASL
jgi:glutamine amidotransferase